MRNPFKKASIPTMSDGQAFLVAGNEGLRNLNRKQLLYEYKNIVFSCVNVRAQEIARYEPLIYNQNPRTVKDRIPLPDHEFLQFLDNPNPYMSKYELFEYTSIFMDLTGEAFWYIALGETSNKPQQVWIIHPHQIEEIWEGNTLLGYKLTKDDGTIIPLEPLEVIHFKLPDPVNPRRGRSPLGANLLYVRTENETSEFQHNFMLNSAIPSGMVSVKSNITPEAFKKLKLQWKDQQRGTKNVGNTLFMRNGDFEYTKVGLSLEDIDISALRAMTQDDVRKAYRVPKPKLGDTDGQGLGRDGAETVNYVFSRDVVDTTQMRFDDTLQRYARLAYKDNTIFIDHVCQIPENETYELEKYKAQIVEWDKGFNRWLSINDIYDEKGLDHIPGGDHIDSLNSPTIETTAKVLRRRTVKALPVAKKKRRITKPEYFDYLDKKYDSSAVKYGEIIKEALRNQKKRILNKLEGLKNIDDELLIGFTIEEQRTILNIVELMYNESEDTGAYATEFVSGTTDYQLSEVFKIALRDDTERIVKGFNEQTTQYLRDTITEGLEEGDNFDMLKTRISNVFDIAENSRVERLARTETHRIINESTSDAYLAAGIYSVQWVTDADPCPLCESMEGTITDIGTPFLSVGDTITDVEGKDFTVDYQDVHSADLHPNCKCKLVPITRNSGKYSVKPEKVIVKIHEDTEEFDRLREALENEKEFNLQLKNIIGLEDE